MDSISVQSMENHEMKVQFTDQFHYLIVFVNTEVGLYVLEVSGGKETTQSYDVVRVVSHYMLFSSPHPSGILGYYLVVKFHLLMMTATYLMRLLLNIFG